jgi:hypothetical protein
LLLLLWNPVAFRFQRACAIGMIYLDREKSKVKSTIFWARSWWNTRLSTSIGMYVK